MKKVTNIDIDKATAYVPDGIHQMGSSGTTVFFKSMFADGTILAWYSHSPWGRYTDGYQGWVVIDPRKKIIIDEVETKSMWMSSGEYRDWRKEMTKKHGKTKKMFTRQRWDGTTELIWKKNNDGF